MKFMLLLYGDEKAWAEATPEQIEQTYAAHGAFFELLESRKAHLAGEALNPVAEAITLRKREGQVLRTDGPFAETVEHLGAFYLIEAKDLDEAIEFAKACPEKIVEIRPVVEYTG